MTDRKLVNVYTPVGLRDDDGELAFHWTTALLKLAREKDFDVNILTMTPVEWASAGMWKELANHVNQGELSARTASRLLFIGPREVACFVGYGFESPELRRMSSALLTDIFFRPGEALTFPADLGPIVKRYSAIAAPLSVSDYDWTTPVPNIPCKVIGGAQVFPIPAYLQTSEVHRLGELTTRPEGLTKYYCFGPWAQVRPLVDTYCGAVSQHHDVVLLVVSYDSPVSDRKRLEREIGFETTARIAVRRQRATGELRAEVHERGDVCCVMWNRPSIAATEAVALGKEAIKWSNIIKHITSGPPQDSERGVVGAVAELPGAALDTLGWLLEAEPAEERAPEVGAAAPSTSPPEPPPETPAEASPEPTDDQEEYVDQLPRAVEEVATKRPLPRVSIAVVVPVRDIELGVLRKTIEGLVQTAHEPSRTFDIKLVVWVNYGSANLVSYHFKLLELLNADPAQRLTSLVIDVNAPTWNLAEARNVGLRRVGDEKLTLFLDADIILNASALNAMVRATADGLAQVMAAPMTQEGRIASAITLGPTDAFRELRGYDAAWGNDYGSEDLDLLERARHRLGMVICKVHEAVVHHQPHGPRIGWVKPGQPPPTGERPDARAGEARFSAADFTRELNVPPFFPRTVDGRKMESVVTPRPPEPDAEQAGEDDDQQPEGD